MLKSLAPKLIIGCLGIGSVTAGTVYAFLPEKYSHQLNKQGRILLTSISDKWDEIKKRYDAEGDDLPILINGQKIAKDNSTLTKIKDWCSKNSNNIFTNTKDENYRRVSAWCTEPKTIEEWMENNKKVLKDEEGTAGKANEHETEWESKKTTYNQAGNNQLIKEITTSNTTEGAEIAVNSLNETSKLRAWCRYSKKKHFKHEEDPRFLKYLKWCVK
ncbi:hypothetical protein A6V39_03800 [Candidatus Mycoplasma haematobovis]|uniref:Uncharacterized protein n=1 Tax=Candidatus Mycoplasma haematobovis TaxID=432608 RepID=A0A1A9QDC9_9MOLU|nr:hypothetical protein [Candidatus Mycoplasma haematobovis]OAL10011.1 hypothetical protein A6V39_03800 [Candidatus Mycoplasma haematobovis]